MQQLGPLETRLVVFAEYFKLPAVCTHGRIAFSGPPVFAGPTWLVTGDDPCHFQERALFHCPRETLPREVQVGGRRVTVTNSLLADHEGHGAGTRNQLVLLQATEMWGSPAASA